MAGIQRPAHPASKLSKVTDTLAAPDWIDVKVQDHRRFWHISGNFNGQHYSQTGANPIALAKAMDAAARAAVPPPREPDPEPPPQTLHDAIVAAGDDIPADEPARPDDGVPDDFRGLMVDGETPERFTLRMKARLQALKHLQMDGSKPTNSRALPDMTDEERAELADLEQRNLKSGNWLA